MTISVINSSATVLLLGLEEITPEPNNLSFLDSSGTGMAGPVLVPHKLSRQKHLLVADNFSRLFTFREKQEMT